MNVEEHTLFMKFCHKYLKMKVLLNFVIYTFLSILTSLCNNYQTLKFLQWYVFYSDLAIAEQKVNCEFVFPQQCLWQNVNLHTKGNNSHLEKIQIQRTNYMMMKLALFLNVALWHWKSYSVSFTMKPIELHTSIRGTVMENFKYQVSPQKTLIRTSNINKSRTTIYTYRSQNSQVYLTRSH